MNSETKLGIIVAIIALLGGVSIGVIYSYRIGIPIASTITQTTTKTIAPNVPSDNSQNVTISGPISAGTSIPIGGTNPVPYEVIFQSWNTGTQFAFPVSGGRISASIPNHDIYDITVEFNYIDSYNNASEIASCSAAPLTINMTSTMVSDDIICTSY